MSDDGTGQDLLPAETTGTLHQRTLDEILDVEKQRIDRDNRRTALLEKSLELVAEQDRRQFEFASKAREDEVALLRDQSSFFRRLMWTLVGVGVVASAALFVLAFFGTDEQRSTASVIATPALIALAGYGVFATLARAMKSITSR